jgi:hypothetical protein
VSQPDLARARAIDGPTASRLRHGRSTTTRGRAGPRARRCAGPATRAALARPWPMRWSPQREPAPGLDDDAALERPVEDLRVAVDAGAEGDLELRLGEGRRALVLDDLDPRPRGDRLLAVLDGGDPADVEAHAGEVLERVAAGRRLRRAEGDADLVAQLVDEHHRGVGLVATPAILRIAWLISRACRPRCWSPMSPSSSARGIRAATESTTIRPTPPVRARVSTMSSACSPQSGCETRRSSSFTPRRARTSRRARARRR